MRKLLPIVLLSLTLGACQSTSDTMGATEMGILNKTCPQMEGSEVGEGDPTITYEGHTIAFCCEGCIDKFNARPAEEKDKFVADALKAAGM